MTDYFIKVQILFAFTIKVLAENDTFVDISIAIDDVWPYEKRIRSFGRSVIVLSPKPFRDAILQDSIDALQFYESLK